MDSQDLHEVLFQWPHTEPYNVIVTGSFDQWSRSVLLSKTPTGFEATIEIPYGDKIKYKFIVDGQWVFRDDLPTDVDPGGYVNNVYVAPHKPMSSPHNNLPPAGISPNSPVDNSGTVVTSTEALVSPDATQPVTATSDGNSDSSKTNGVSDITKNSNDKVANGTTDSEQKLEVAASIPQLISDIATTIAAADGTSSAFSYVASGIGAAVHSVIGVDPVNPEQIAIPTPATANEFNVPSVHPETPASQTDHVPDAVSPCSTQLQGSDSLVEDTPSPIAPAVPISILPVNASEHNTVGSDLPAGGTDLGAKSSIVVLNSEIPVTPDAPSTHTTVVLAADGLGDTTGNMPEIKEGTSSPLETATLPAHSTEHMVNLEPSPPTDVAPLSPVTPNVSQSKDERSEEITAAKPAPEFIPPVNVKVQDKELDASELATNGPAKAETSVSVPPPVPDNVVSELAAKAHTTTETSDPPATPTKQPSSNGGTSSSHPTPSSKKGTIGRSPSTPTKRFFPRSSSPSPSASSSNYGTTSSTRKKRQSIFGKVKNLFHHDKEKSEEKK